jgi:hypothetical protein
MMNEMDAEPRERHTLECPVARSEEKARSNRGILVLTIAILSAFLLGQYGFPFKRLSDQQIVTGVQSAKAAGSISAKITVLSETAEGQGTYNEPFVIDSTDVEWKIDIDGENKENVLYRVTVHMDYIRSCATKSKWDDLTFQDIQERDGKFHYTTDMAGWYYLRIDVNEGEGYDELYDARTRVFFRVPPINPYDLPYIYPAENQKPTPRIEILNALQGTGSYTNPFMIDSPIVEFRMDSTEDPDGVEDLVNGVFLWAIHTQGHHPVYAKGEQIQEAKDTFLYYPEIMNTIFEWDTRERPSENDYYFFVAAVIDQHGEKNSTDLHFKVSTTCLCSAWENQGCGQGNCEANEMLQTRVCSPSGCSLETRCIASPICGPTGDPEDINLDGNVDEIDVNLCKDVFLLKETRSDIVERADVNNDGKVNISDLQQIVNRICGG